MTRALLLLCLFGFAARGAEEDAESLEGLVQARIDTIREQFHVPSISTSVVQGNATILLYSPGFANVARAVEAQPGSVYALASVTKPMTATALLRLLHERADRSRTDSVKPLLEDVVAPSSTLDGITFEHVLSHRLSITDSNPPPDDEYMLWGDDASSRRLDQALASLTVGPSTLATYDNEAYLIAGYLLARLEGDVSDPARTTDDYERAMDKYVFDHLAMYFASNRPTPEMVEHLALPYRWVDPAYEPLAQRRFTPMPAGECYASILDLNRFLRAHLNAVAVGPVGLIDSDVSVAMRTPVATTISDFSLGMGWWIWPNGSRTYVDHDGVRNGYRAYIVFDPDAKTGMCFLTNGHCDTDIIDHFYNLAVDVFSLLASLENQYIPVPMLAPEPPPPWPEPPAAFPPKTFLLVRGLDTVAVQAGDAGLRVATPGRSWALRRPKQGEPSKYEILPFLGGTFRRVPGAPPATVDNDGLRWGTGMAGPFAPVRPADLAPYQGEWGGAILDEPSAIPVTLDVAAGSVRLLTRSQALELAPAADADGRLVGLAGRHLSDMVRVVLEVHAAGGELVGTWQSGTRRRLLHLRRGAAAGWRAARDPVAWSGTWKGDLARGLEWTAARITATDHGATMDCPALEMQGAKVEDVRRTGDRVSFSARGWRFSGRLAGPIFSGSANNGHDVVHLSLRRSGN